HRADAALLIGDPALGVSVEIASSAKRGGSGEQVCPAGSAGTSRAGTLAGYDVVEEWRKMTNLPAVLAVWAARFDVASPDVIEDFQASRDFGLKNIDEISRQAAQELALPPGE